MSAFTQGRKDGQQLSRVFLFATDANGDPDEWQVALYYRRVVGSGEFIDFLTTLRVGDAVEADLFEDTENGIGAASLSVGSWTVTENTVLLLQMLDHFLLLSAQPTSQQDKSELQWQWCHRLRLARPERAKIG